ncbi:hypothetical protein HRbin27_00675 [bacterium HR27]|nr:hypothetical protein HRbin27_00675 [bacterium HR27]
MLLARRSENEGRSEHEIESAAERKPVWIAAHPVDRGRCRTDLLAGALEQRVEWLDRRDVCPTGSEFADQLGWCQEGQDVAAASHDTALCQRLEQATAGRVVRRRSSELAEELVDDELALVGHGGFPSLDDWCRAQGDAQTDLPSVPVHHECHLVSGLMHAECGL